MDYAFRLCKVKLQRTRHIHYVRNGNIVIFTVYILRSVTVVICNFTRCRRVSSIVKEVCFRFFLAGINRVVKVGHAGVTDLTVIAFTPSEKVAVIVHRNGKVITRADVTDTCEYRCGAVLRNRGVCFTGCNCVCNRVRVRDALLVNNRTPNRNVAAVIHSRHVVKAD